MVHLPRIPAARTAALVALLAAVSSAGANSHTVRRGETLTGIAVREHTTVAALVRLNGMSDPDLIRIGQKLRVPGTSLSPRLIAATRPVETSGYHVVAPGETVAGVAAAFGVSSVALAAANGVTNNMLYAGARIRVDVAPAGAPPDPALPFVAQRLVVRGRWVCPVAGPVRYMNDWGFSRLGGNWHQGIDLMAHRGTPVVAPVAGRVVRYPNKLGGNAFELYGNDGIRYYGAHLDRYGAAGRVRAGTVIGYVGDSGDAKGGATHLHFEIHPGGGAAVPPFPTIALACRSSPASSGHGS